MFKCIAHPQLIALTHPPPYMPIDFVFVRLYMIIFISPFLSRNNGVAQFFFYQSAEKLYVTDVLHDMFKEPNNNKTTYIHTHAYRQADRHIYERACMHAYKYSWWRIECNLHCLMHTTPACVPCLHNDFNDLFGFVVSPMILPNRLHSMQLTKIRATHSARII